MKWYTIVLNYWRRQERRRAQDFREYLEARGSSFETSAAPREMTIRVLLHPSELPEIKSKLQMIIK